MSYSFSKKFSFAGPFSEHLARLSLALRLFLGRNQFDIVAAGRYGEFYALLQSFFGSRPFLLLDIEWYKTSPSWRGHLNRWVHRRIVAGASRIQVFCHAEARNYSTFFGVSLEKFVWIPYCTSAAALTEPPAPGDYLFTSGTHQRDYATLLEAVRGLPFELRIAAPHSAFATLDVPPNVTILGALSPDQYQRVMLGSRMVVVSLDPNVLRRPGVITYVSAMQAGKCVIVNDPLGAASYIRDGHTGYLTEAASPVALRDRLLALWNDLDGIQETAVRGQKAAMEQFSAASYIRYLQAAVAETLGGAQPRDNTL